MLLKELDMIDDIKFAHPKDMQDGTILISDTDITTNLPYVEGVRLAFDHHSSEITRVEDKKDNYINDPQAPSAARVDYRAETIDRAVTKDWFVFPWEKAASRASILADWGEQPDRTA